MTSQLVRHLELQMNFSKVATVASTSISVVAIIASLFTGLTPFLLLSTGFSGLAFGAWIMSRHLSGLCRHVEVTMLIDSSTLQFDEQNNSLSTIHQQRLEIIQGHQLVRTEMKSLQNMLDPLFRYSLYGSIACIIPFGSIMLTNPAGIVIFICLGTISAMLNGATRMLENTISRSNSLPNP